MSRGYTRLAGGEVLFELVQEIDAEVGLDSGYDGFTADVRYPADAGHNIPHYTDRYINSPVLGKQSIDAVFERADRFPDDKVFGTVRQLSPTMGQSLEVEVTDATLSPRSPSSRTQYVELTYAADDEKALDIEREHLRKGYEWAAERLGIRRVDEWRTSPKPSTTIAFLSGIGLRYTIKDRADTAQIVRDIIRSYRPFSVKLRPVADNNIFVRK